MRDRAIFNLIIYGFCVLLWVVWWNCSDNPVDVEKNDSPVLSDLRAPSLVFNASAKKHRISVRVTGAQGTVAALEVSFSIKKMAAASAVVAGKMLDDGKDGDVLLADGVFSYLLPSNFAQGDTGAFELEAIATNPYGQAGEPLKTFMIVKPGLEKSAPQIVGLITPPGVPIDSTFNFIIAAQVADPDGYDDIASVSYEFYPPRHATPSAAGELLDDGNSGDNAAGDGIFSAMLSSQLFSEINDYFLRVEARDHSGESSSPVVKIIRGRFKVSQAPVINAITLPEIVNINTTTAVLITADVTDPDGLGDVDSAQVKLLRSGQHVANSPRRLLDDGDITNSGDGVAGDGTFSTIFPLAFPGLENPTEVNVIFQAKDKSGVLSKEFRENLVVSNSDAPYISNLEAPALVFINPSRDTQILVTIDVRDPQGLANIALAQFRSYLPSGQEAQDSPIALLDNGNNDNGDDEAGDGIYSRFVFLPSSGVTPGDYRWVFEARDKTGLVSNTIEHILTVEQ